MSKTRNNQKECTLGDIPAVIIYNHIICKANVDEKKFPWVLSNLSEISKSYHQFFKPDLDQHRAKELLTFVLQRNERCILDVAEKQPKLFFIKATAMDYASDLEGNRRVIKHWSAFQALFGSGNGKMVDKIMPYLKKYLENQSDGFKKAWKQIEEKFPEGLKYSKKCCNFNLLTAAISQDTALKRTGSPTKNTLDELGRFKENFKQGVIDSGHHFNMNEILAAYKVVSKTLFTWNPAQHQFFIMNVIGFLQRLLPFHYLTALLNEGISPAFLYGFIVASHDKNPSWRLGVHYCIDYYGVSKTMDIHDWPSMLAYKQLKYAVKHNTHHLIEIMKDIKAKAKDQPREFFSKMSGLHLGFEIVSSLR